MSTSMINGSPLKAMLRFAMPLLFGNLLQQTYNIIDAAHCRTGAWSRCSGQRRSQAAVFSFWFLDSVWESPQDLAFR